MLKCLSPLTCFTMLFRLLFPFLIIPSVVLADERADERLADYYRRAVPGAEQFLQRSQNFPVYSLFDNMAILVSANADLPNEQRPGTNAIQTMLRIAETMQDRNPESPHFGNFRWYRNQTGVTDPNAVEFAAIRMLSIILDTPDGLTDADRSLVSQMLVPAAHACLNRRIPPDYTNIALYNAVNLILLGQVFDRLDWTQEGTYRFHNIAYHTWDHGIFEYNSPAYYFVDVDTLQLALRHVRNPLTKQTVSALLELFWTDLSLHWYKPGLRLAGAQSRTNNYLFGTSVQMTRHFSFAGLAPFDNRSRYHALLNSFRTLYQLPPNVAKLHEQYSRVVTRNWGKESTQWTATYICDDIALGTAGAKYDSQQNMVQTVDIADDDQADKLSDWQYKPRSYFIADGREDPYGTKLYATGRGGQQKPLHLDALWFSAQRTVDSLGLVLYPPEILDDPVVKNVQSHFVVRKPESLWLDGKQISLLPHQPIDVKNNAIVFRYKTCAFGIRTVWSRHQNGKRAETYLIDDGNEHGVYRLTAEHGKPLKQRTKTYHKSMLNPLFVSFVPNFVPFVVKKEDEPQSSQRFAQRTQSLTSEQLSVRSNTNWAGAVFWIRIGSHLETDEQFSDWQKQFIDSKVHRLDVTQNNVEIKVAGQEGIVAVKRTDSTVQTEPPAPLGILTLNGKDLGRSILETIPQVQQYVKQRNETKPVIVHADKTCWEAETGYAFFEPERQADSSASGGVALQVNNDVSWQLQVDRSGEYELWGRVQTRDPQHDSFYVEWAKRLPDGSFMHRAYRADWHLGVRANWTWIRLPMPLQLEKGIWQLTIKPREYEGRIDKLSLLPPNFANPF